MTGFQQSIVHNRPALSLTQTAIGGIKPGQLLLLIILEEFVKFRIIGNVLGLGLKSGLAALNPGILSKGFGYVGVVSHVLAAGQSQGLQPAGDTGQTLSFFIGTGMPIIGAAALLVNNEILNVFLYGSSVYACLGSTFGSLVVCAVVSCVWTLIYNTVGSTILALSDVY